NVILGLDAPGIEARDWPVCSKPMNLSIVIPAYNEQSRLPKTLDVLERYLEELDVDSWEIVVVDDGSSDRTAEKAEEWAERGVRVVRLECNRGKGSALRQGVKLTQGGFVFFVDADLPYRLDFIERALGLLRGQADAVIGARDLPESSYDSSFPKVRVWTGKAFSYVIRALLPLDVFDTQCGFKGFRGDLIRSAASHAHVEGYTIDIEILLMLRLWKARIERQPVHLERHHGSKVRLLRDSARMLGEVLRIRRRLARGRYPSARPG
ncbi:MAG TPA: glycosyltransferase, partial [Acidobacteriota bacterium]|nr:glycosyltransferase [Acidobacteriota bacterium]